MKITNKKSILSAVFFAMVGVFLLPAFASAATVNFLNLEITARRDTSLVVKYDTDIAATGQIEYGLTAGYGNLTAEEGLSYWHPLEVTGLTPGTTYHYRIRAKDYKDNETISNNLTFTTRTVLELENVIRAARINGNLPKTYYVSPSGSDDNNGLSLETAWATPYYAGSVAEAGDTILVADGTYSGYVDFGWYVRPGETWGISEAPITMKAYSGRPEITNGNFIIRADYITIDGFVVHDVSGKGIDIESNTGINILNCEVYNTVGSDGIYIRDSTYVIIDNFYVHDTGWNGVGIKPTAKYPFTGHHFILRNGRVIDTWYHNSFDVQADYLTIENCITDNIPGNEPGDQILGAPYRISIYHSVINNCSGEHGNNGVKTAETSREFIIINSTFPDYGFNSNTIAGDWGNIILHGNYINNIPYAMYLYLYGNNLIEENEVYSQEVYGYTYGFVGDVNANVTIRNEVNSPYIIHASVSGSTTVTVEYTDGRVFSVNGAGEYTTYTWDYGIRTIEVTGSTSIGNVDGIVTDTATGLGIQGATVTVEGTGKSATTFANGSYLISAVPTGTYNVICTAPIYDRLTKSNVIVSEGLTTAVNFVSTKETTPPTIASDSPTGTGVAINTNIFATFSEEMNKTSAQNAFSISPSVLGSFNWNGNQMIFTPDSDLDYLTTYTVNIGVEAEDLAGNNLTSSYSWQFTTKEQDLTHPVISNVTVPTVTGSSAIITWTTDEPSTSQIEHGLTSSYGSSTALDTNLATTHSRAIAGLNPSTTYHYRAKSKDETGNEAVSNNHIFNTTAQLSGLVAHWSFDENSGTVANDSSGNNNGTLQNNPIWTTGKLGSALQFDGVDDYVNCGSNASLHNHASMTVSFWINYNYTDNFRYGIISHFNGNDISNGNRIGIDYYDRVNIYYRMGGSQGLLATPVYGSVVDGVWHHVAAVLTNGLQQIYLNGIASGNTGTIAADLDGGSRSLYIGDTWSWDNFNGSIDEVKIYSRALTPEEVLAEYNAGNTTPPTDTTPPAGSITINNNDNYTTLKDVNLAVSATDTSGVSEMKISNTNNFSSAVAEAYNTVKSWTLSTVDGLKTVYIWFKDTVGNWNASPYTDTITLDSIGPTISNIQSTNISTTSAIITWTTNENATSQIEYGLTSSYKSQTTKDEILTTSHTVNLTNLSDNTIYHYRTISEDGLNNFSQSIDNTFTTNQSSTPDQTPPQTITNLSSSNITQTSADLSWTSPGDDNNTGTASTYDIRYSTSNITEANWNSATQISGEPIPQSAETEQSIYVAVGLSPNTTYYFAIKTSDEVPNISDISNVISFATLAEDDGNGDTSDGGGGNAGTGGTVSDTTSPSHPSNFTATGADKQIILKWTNPTDSDFVRVLIVKKENSAPTSKDDGTIIYEGTNEEYTDINLDNNKIYYYAIFAYDKKPNYSNILTISAKPEAGKESISNGNKNDFLYPEGTLLKTPDSFKIYVIINNKKKWIPTPEVFETLGYQWGNITELNSTTLKSIPNYEDNLIRAINDYRVYLVVNGIKRHIPNPEIFLNYGFAWEDVVDISQSTIDKYTRAHLIRESRQGTIYYLREDGVRKWIRNPEIFASYNNSWDDIQVISKPEIDAYPESNLIQLSGDNRIYLIENNAKHYISSASVFNKYGYNWEHVIIVNRMEWDWYGVGRAL